ncbi:hypothetical protein ACFGVR_21040 [Mucilaginibacter sp. AW1-3]
MTNYPSQQSPKTMLKTIPLIHLGLLGGQVLFAIVTLVITPGSTFNIKFINDPYLYTIPMMAVISSLSTVLYKQLLTTAINKPTVQQKVTGYQTAMIARLAMLEGASLFGIVVYQLTANLLYLVVSGIIILFFIVIRPTRDKIETDLNLDYQDKAELDNDGISNEQKY